LIDIIGDLALSSSWVDTCEVLNRFKSNIMSAGAQHEPAHCNYQEIHKFVSEISVLITTLWQAKRNSPSELQTTPSPVYLQEQPTFEFESLQNEELDKCCRKLIQSLIDYAWAWTAVRWPPPVPGDIPHQSEDTDYDQNFAKLKLKLQSTRDVVLGHLNELHSIFDIPGHDIQGHETNSCAEELQSELVAGSTHHGELDWSINGNLGSRCLVTTVGLWKESLGVGPKDKSWIRGFSLIFRTRIRTHLGSPKQVWS
jgi:hypothetical protein